MSYDKQNRAALAELAPTTKKAALQPRSNGMTTVRHSSINHTCSSTTKGMVQTRFWHLRRRSVGLTNLPLNWRKETARQSFHIRAGHCTSVQGHGQERRRTHSTRSWDICHW